jgi:hypothetical protein
MLTGFIGVLSTAGTARNPISVISAEAGIHVHRKETAKKGLGASNAGAAAGGCFVGMDLGVAQGGKSIYKNLLQY